MIFIQTEGLIIRNLCEKDVGIIYDYRNNEICARYQRGQVKDYDGILDMIKSHKDDEISPEYPSVFAIALKDSDELVGEIAVMPADGTISLGYTISYRHHRKGFAFEALNALINCLHEKFPDCDFISFTESENVPSMALLKKLGYKYLGYLPSKKSQVFGKWTSAKTEEEIAKATK